jgi:hypothetical protein
MIVEILAEKFGIVPVELENKIENVAMFKRSSTDWRNQSRLNLLTVIHKGMSRKNLLSDWNAFFGKIFLHLGDCIFAEMGN